MGKKVLCCWWQSHNKHTRGQLWCRSQQGQSNPVNFNRWSTRRGHLSCCDKWHYQQQLKLCGNSKWNLKDCQKLQSRKSESSILVKKNPRSTAVIRQVCNDLLRRLLHKKRYTFYWQLQLYLKIYDFPPERHKFKYLSKTFCENIKKVLFTRIDRHYVNCLENSNQTNALDSDLQWLIELK